MHKLIKKLLEKLDITTALFFAVLMLGVLCGVTYVLATDNVATQSASTSQATTLSIVGQLADTAVTTITFPVGAPSAAISNPYNQVDTVSSPQLLDPSSSKPVARIKNTSAGTLDVWLEIATWANGVAAAEAYALVPVATTTVNAVTTALSTDGNAASVDTSTTIAASAYDGLYLKLTLSSLAGKTGTSDPTILGATP